MTTVRRFLLWLSVGIVAISSLSNVEGTPGGKDKIPESADIPLKAGETQLGKVVATFSKTPISFSSDPSEEASPKCPPGEEGLQCRREEARKGADECPGGECENCRKCDTMTASEWPQCCKNNFRCCKELAGACQRCDRPELKSFCAKHFKRCFS